MSVCHDISVPIRQNRCHNVGVPVGQIRCPNICVPKSKRVSQHQFRCHHVGVPSVKLGVAILVSPVGQIRCHNIGVPCGQNSCYHIGVPPVRCHYTGVSLPVKLGVTPPSDVPSVESDASTSMTHPHIRCQRRSNQVSTSAFISQIGCHNIGIPCRSTLMSQHRFPLSVKVGATT